MDYPNMSVAQLKLIASKKKSIKFGNSKKNECKSFNSIPTLVYCTIFMVLALKKVSLPFPLDPDCF